MIKTWEDIPGFFDFQEIYDQAVREARDGDTLVEIGCFLGKSAAYMSERIRQSGKNISLCCIDKWDEHQYKTWWISDDPPLPAVPEELIGKPLHEAFVYCMDATGSKATVFREDSAYAARRFPNGSLRFIFIDADHTHPAIDNDIAAWRSKVAPSGILGGHDYRIAMWPAVTQAVDATFGDKVQHIGTSWIVRR